MVSPATETPESTIVGEPDPLSQTHFQFESLAPVSKRNAIRCTEGVAEPNGSAEKTPAQILELVTPLPTESVRILLA